MSGPPSTAEQVPPAGRDGGGRESHAPGPSLLARASPLVAARLTCAAITFCIPLALARNFVPAEYGTYKQLVLIAQTLYYLLPLGMSQALYFFLPRARHPRPFLVQTVLYLGGAGLVAIGAALFGAGLLSRGFDNPRIAHHALALAVYTFGLLGSMPLEVALTAQGRQGAAAVAYLASDAVKAAAMTVPALLGFGLDGVMLGMAGFALARLVATWGLLLRGPGPAFDRSALKAQLSYSLPFGLAVAIAIPQQFFHQYVVSAGLDTATFAVYAVGIFQVPVFDLLYAPTSEVLMVRIAELEREGRTREAAASFRDAVLKLAFFFVPATVYLVVIAPELIGALFTSRYLAAAPVFQVCTLAGLLACLPVEGALRARGETRRILMSNAVKALVTVPLVLVGVAKFGMMGGVGSWLLAEIIGKAVLLARLPRALGVRPKDVFPWSGLARPAAASLIAVSGVIGTRLAFGPTQRWWSVSLVAAAAYGVCYLGVQYLLGARLPPLAWPWRRVRPVPSPVPADGEAPPEVTEPPLRTARR